jgi:GAF domain-containing protein
VSERSGPADPGSTDEPATDARTRDLAARFRAVWTSDVDSATADPDLLPTRLTRACVELLRADGAGLSLYDADFRVPLGASDEVATLAEQLQFTHGEGPCLDAGRNRRVLAVDQEQMAATWPAYTAELLQRTPFTAIISLPLITADNSSGALDLFFTDAGRLQEVSLADATTITEQMTEALALAQQAGEQEPETYAIGGVSPAWLQTTTAHVRAHVWIATGITMARFQVDASDAVALLRSYAYGRGSVLDDVAVALVEGRLSIDKIMA